MDLELKLLPKWQCCHPVSNLPRFFSLSSPKDPTHCNAAGPQLKSCWREAGGRKTHSFPKDLFKSKDLPHSGANNTHRRLFINSHPAMRDCIPPAASEILRKIYMKYVTCQSGIFYPQDPKPVLFPCFALQFPMVSHIPLQPMFAPSGQWP